MENKVLITALACFCTTTMVFASDKIHVSALSEFSTATPTETIKVMVLEDSSLGSHELKEGDIINSKVVKITKPKRAKRDAGFTVQPISYTRDDNTVIINETFNGKYSERILSKEELKNIDKKKVGKKVAITVGGHFVKGLSPAVSMVEGMVKNEDGNVIKSGVKKVYKDSPLSYAEKGEQIVINPEDKFYFIFKQKENTSSNSEDIIKTEDIAPETTDDDLTEDE